MMKTAATVMVAVLTLSACSSSKTVAPVGATRDAASIDARVQSGGAPSAEDYALARASFVAELTDFVSEQRRKADSPGPKIRSAIVGAGSILGIGGLVASFVVKDEDTRSKVAQASAGVGAVSGIVGLLPVGRGSSGAAAAVTYLDVELPRFEQRWPAAMDSVSVEDWALFYSDCQHIEAVVADLQEIR